MSLVAVHSADVATRPAGPIDVGDRRQVFVDETFLPESRGVRLCVHQPRKTGERNIVVDRPWEKGGLGPYSSVLYDGGKYHMWYHAMDQKLWDSSPEAGSICYATSDDGIRWTKPDLGIIEYDGSRSNNIVVGHGAAGLKVGQDGVMVFIDPNAPPDQRLRMVSRFDKLGEGVHLLSSGDGIHWRVTHPLIMTARKEVKGHHLDSQNVMFWDPTLKKYVAYVRRNRKEGENRGRAIARAESPKLGDFPLAQDLPVVFSPDSLDYFDGMPVIDYYNSAALRYPWADSAYFLFPQSYFHYTRQIAKFGKNIPTNAGALHTQFASSRDGFHWQRFDRRPFIPLGMKGDFDCYTTRMIYGVVPDQSGNEMYMYYRGSDWLHGWDRDERNRKILTEAGLGGDRDITILSRVVLRRDGFISVRAEYAGGEITTGPLTFSGKELFINVDTSATGLMRCELLDENSKPIEGYTIKDCDLIHTANEINRVVTWKGKSDISSLAGKPVRLHVAFRDADLYAFQFRSE